MTGNPLFRAPPSLTSLSVSGRFTALLNNLSLTKEQVTDGVTKFRRVATILGKAYYGDNAPAGNAILVGSWAKGTQIRPPRDVDILFRIPYSTYGRFEQRIGNRQSQLLQEVRTELAKTYPNTDMRGDGQVVLVHFLSYAVEVVPAVLLKGGQYWVCNTREGGNYKTFDPKAEVKYVIDFDALTKGNTRKLVKMLKCWQDECSVPIKSFHLELLAIDFLRTWPHADKSTVYYDWMVRDFFRHMVGRAEWSMKAPGTGEWLSLGSEWKSRAETALDRATKACEHEAQSYAYLAGEEWQKIFGTYIPIC